MVLLFLYTHTNPLQKATSSAAIISTLPSPSTSEVAIENKEILSSCCGAVYASSKECVVKLALLSAKVTLNGWLANAARCVAVFKTAISWQVAPTGTLQVSFVADA